MLLAQLTSFVEIARTGNLSRAAEALFVTQPALTSRLQVLERELGSELFVRTRRGMRLTAAGKAFLPFAVRSLETVAEGRRLVAEIAQGGAGELTIGAAPAVSTYVLPALLKEFHEAHPKVRLSVRTGHSEEVLELVLRGQVEVGLTRQLRHADIVSEPVYEDELVLVANRDHPFARRVVIRMEELASEELILFDRTSSYHDLTNALFRAAGVEPAGVMELDNIDAAKKMVQQGLGVALLPQTAVAAELDAGSLRVVVIAGAEPVRRQIVAIRRRDAGPPSGAAAAFMQTLAGRARELTV
ncbi:MAG TPA: LysR substrate-binding domain-containing protein [Gaiellaceae bacterium]|nr:LysR substrate-binding domain-containing protein [Gaiellaceae bacterium]